MYIVDFFRDLIKIHRRCYFQRWKRTRLETKFIDFGSIVIPTLLSSRAKEERKKD